jgi:tungstate transport system ATP-binding protein
MSPHQPVLETKNLLIKRGGITVLDIVEFSVEKGQFVGLIGPNGAGKSTLLLALAKLLKAERGDIYFKGHKVDSGSGVFTYRRNLSMVFQEPLLFDATVHNNIASGLKIRGTPSKEIQNTVKEHLERFGISHLAKRSARKLSGGEAQRTSLARAFATRPEIIFLDEPFSSLDPPTREALIDDLQRNLHETGTTAVMATHDQMEALRLADQIAVMNQGQIIQVGPPGQVMNHPVNEFVAAFVGMENIMSGRVLKTGEGTLTVGINGQEIEIVGEGKAGDNIICCIRPENITLFLPGAYESTSARNILPAKVVKITPSGLFTKIILDCGFCLTAYVTFQSVENLALKEGSNIFASFKATAIHIIKQER